MDLTVVPYFLESLTLSFRNRKGNILIVSVTFWQGEIPIIP